MGKLEKMFGQIVVKQRWWIIVATVLIVATAAGGMRHLAFNNDTRVFFSGKNPQLQALEALENTYNKTNNVLFAIAPENGDIFTRETLAAVEELTEFAWQIPYSSRVNSITNFQHTRAEEDDLIVEDLVQGAGNLSDDDLLRIKRIALSEPLLANRLLSPVAHVTGVSVIILAPGKSLNETPKVAAFARKMADDFRKKHPGIKLYLTGGVMMDNAFGEAGLKDMSTLVPLMLLPGSVDAAYHGRHRRAFPAFFCRNFCYAHHYSDFYGYRDGDGRLVAHYDNRRIFQRSYNYPHPGRSRQRTCPGNDIPADA